MTIQTLKKIFQNQRNVDEKETKSSVIVQVPLKKFDKNLDKNLTRNSILVLYKNLAKKS